MNRAQRRREKALGDSKETAVIRFVVKNISTIPRQFVCICYTEPPGYATERPTVDDEGRETGFIIKMHHDKKVLHVFRDEGHLIAPQEDAELEFRWPFQFKPREARYMPEPENARCFWLEEFTFGADRIPLLLKPGPF